MFLSKSDFSKVVGSTPLISIDLIILKDRKLLVGKRTNPPAKNFFFVPGGRILKSELKNDALKRILKNELSMDIKINHERFIKFLGIYEHFYQDNFLDNKDFSTHYVVLAYVIPYKILKKIKKKILIEQHSELIWIDINNFNSNTNHIHSNTLEYLKNPLLKNFC